MLVCKEEDFTTKRKVQNVMQEQMRMHRGKKRQNVLEEWWNVILTSRIAIRDWKKKDCMVIARSHGAFSLSTGIFLSTYPCLWLKQPTYSAKPPTPQSLLFLEHSKHHPVLRPSLLLFPLPEIFFPQTSFWLFPSHPSGLCYVTASMRPTLISIFNIATPPPCFFS